MKRLLRGFLALAVVFSLAPAAWANVAATSEVGSSSTPIKTVVVTSDTDRPNPYKLTTDLSINVTDGTCIVYYR